MERRTLPGRLSWQLGEVVATQAETARARSITVTVPNWIGHRVAVASLVPTRLLYSSRSFEEVIYRDELDRLVKDTSMLEVVQTLTRV